MKYICTECDWVGTEPLFADNPFYNGAVILGCPECHEVGICKIACDELECTELASCGTPTPTGYRLTCWKHKPK